MLSIERRRFLGVNVFSAGDELYHFGTVVVRDSEYGVVSLRYGELCDKIQRDSFKRESFRPRVDRT